MAGRYKYLTFEDRQKIEVWHARGDRPLVEIAARLGVHTATIYNELKRGYVGELDSRQREIYKAERAQATVQEHIKRWGRTAATFASPKRYFKFTPPGFSNAFLLFFFLGENLLLDAKIPHRSAGFLPASFLSTQGGGGGGS